MKELLTDTLAYLRPRAILTDLSADEAARRVTGSTHTIAEIVAHLAFWQDWFLGRCRGEGRPMVASAADGWSAVSAQAWPSVRDRFLDGLDAAIEIGGDASRAGRPIDPAIEFPPLAAYTVRDALTHVAVHNAHHLGQVVTLRQVMQRWPPEAGSWTW